MHRNGCRLMALRPQKVHTIQRIPLRVRCRTPRNGKRKVSHKVLLNRYPFHPLRYRSHLPLVLDDSVQGLGRCRQSRGVLQFLGDYGVHVFMVFGRCLCHSIRSITMGRKPNPAPRKTPVRNFARRRHRRPRLPNTSRPFTHREGIINA